MSLVSSWTKFCSLLVCEVLVSGRGGSDEVVVVEEQATPAVSVAAAMTVISRVDVEVGMGSADHIGSPPIQVLRHRLTIPLRHRRRCRCFNRSVDLVRHLEYFVAVAEERHFGRAAASLGVTQPPVSRAIKALEKHLGLTLVERTPDGAAITEHGAALLPRARLIVDDAHRLSSTAQSLTTSETVRIGLIPQLDDALAARIAASVGVQARVTTGSALALLDAVRSHELDVAVIDHPVVLDRVVAGPVITLPRRISVPVGHRSARAERPRLTMLSDLAFATTSRTANPPAHDLLLDAFRRHALDPEVLVSNTFRDISIGVASGRCFALVPAASPVLPGTAHLGLASEDVALRVRIVRRDDDAASLVTLVDRILLQAQK